MKHVKEFVKKYYLMAQRSEKVTGVPFLVTLAQAALESGWGRYAPGNNFFGIKNSDSSTYGEQEKITKEFINGEEVTIIARFETYPSAEAAFTHHGQLLNRNFPLAFRYNDPLNFITAVQKEHNYKYATDPKYIKKIQSIMKMINEVLPKPYIKIKAPPIKGVELIKKNRSNSMAKLILVTPSEKPNVELGISEVLDIVNLFGELGEAYEKASEDGEITFGDFITSPGTMIIDPIKAAFKVYDGYQLILPQIEDINFDEAQEIIDAVVTRFKLSEGTAKVVVENSIKAAFHSFTVFKAFQK